MVRLIITCITINKQPFKCINENRVDSVTIKVEQRDYRIAKIFTE